MRVLSLLSHPTILLVLQQIVIIWFLVDFFLARDSATSSKLFDKHLTRSEASIKIIQKIENLSSDLRDNLACDDLLIKNTTFDKVIFIIIDALGAEFIPTIEGIRGTALNNPHKMPFVQQSLTEGRIMGVIAKAATPTVTMPRVKALISGSIPSFVDILYNVVTDKDDFHEDNFLSSAKAHNRSLVFYGDDTWLSLFDKSMFRRSRATLSLYASDYISVDTNVTEMAIPETTKDPIDWDFMILHYLGLDHLGHVFGTNRLPLIDQKLIEMDTIIKQLYDNMSTKSHKTLMIICGDHGMSLEGNHGGDSPLETDTAMLLIPIDGQTERLRFDHLKHATIAQIDLAVTVSLLTGLPIPANSRGVMIESFLSKIWRGDSKRLTCAVATNLKQMSMLLDDYQLRQPGGMGERILNLFARIHSGANDEGLRAVEEGLILARLLQTHMVRTVAAKTWSFLVVTLIVIVMALSIINMRRACNRLLLPLMTASERLTCLGALLAPILLLNSTDFIEAEHIYWPVHLVTVATLFCVISLRTHPIKSITNDVDRLRVVLFLATLMVIALWNRVHLFQGEGRGWTLPVISVLLLCNFTRQTSGLTGKLSFTPFIFGALLLAEKYYEESSQNHESIASLQLVTLVVFTLAGLASFHTNLATGQVEPTSIVLKMATFFMWWVFLLSRSRNYLFLVSNVMMEASLNSLSNSFLFKPITRAILYLSCASAAFYGQGNTNLFSSLDIKPAFFGQTKYSLVLSVPLIASAAFGAQIYWYVKLFQRVQGEKEQDRMSTRRRLPGEIGTSKLVPTGTKEAIKDFVDMRNFLTIAYYMFVCIVLRDHLFIWTVLSPKLVYLFVTTLTLRLVTAVVSITPELLQRLASSLGYNSKTVKYKTMIA